ncbi:inositol 2-dehydrogenase-like [Prorops nasuta]|uniref:inositol 2-dehydrogenase-like n=1 Tax=Prorops nasuta TaxID=863751 RepID=UPI0034CD2772
MATAKFKDISPYVKPRPSPTYEDYLYKKYMEDLNAKSDGKKEPVLKVAIFGLGRAGTIHLTSAVINPRIKLEYIIDDVESKWNDLKTYWRLDDVRFLNSKQSDIVYKDPTIDAVIVASPTFTHEDIVTKALQAGKSVFCEKPIAETREATMRIYDTAMKMGKPLLSAFNRRFDPSYSTVRDRVRNGEVGHVHSIKTVSRDSPLPTIDYLKHSGGIFHDCMVHDIDLITWILGELPTRVATQAHSNIPEIKEINDFDTIMVTLYFPSGTLGMIDLSRNSPYGYDMRLEAFGPKGMIHAANEQPIHCVTAHKDLTGITSPPIWYSFASRFQNAYRKELDHFIDVVHKKAELIVKPKESLATTKIADACEKSARTGQMVEIKWTAEEMP